MILTCQMFILLFDYRVSLLSISTYGNLGHLWSCLSTWQTVMGVTLKTVPKYTINFWSPEMAQLPQNTFIPNFSSSRVKNMYVVILWHRQTLNWYYYSHVLLAVLIFLLIHRLYSDNVLTTLDSVPASGNISHIFFCLVHLTYLSRFPGPILGTLLTSAVFVTSCYPILTPASVISFITSHAHFLRVYLIILYSHYYYQQTVFFFPFTVHGLSDAQSPMSWSVSTNILLNVTYFYFPTILNFYYTDFNFIFVWTFFAYRSPSSSTPTVHASFCPSSLAPFLSGTSSVCIYIYLHTAYWRKAYLFVHHNLWLLPFPSVSSFTSTFFSSLFTLLNLCGFTSFPTAISPLSAPLTFLSAESPSSDTQHILLFTFSYAKFSIHFCILFTPLYPPSVFRPHSEIPHDT